MRKYLDLLQKLLDEGKEKENRTGVNALTLYGEHVRYNLEDGFPLLTTKKMHLKSIIYELLWFLSGDTNVKYLQDHGVTIWDAWSTIEHTSKFGRQVGELGPIYPHQWTNARATKLPDGTYAKNGINQITRAINLIKNNPRSRRIVISSWDPKECDDVTLPPCHTLFQFNVDDDRLICHLFQRSADYFLGVPFNISSYALLTMMIAQVCGLKPGEFIHTYGNIHLYVSHIDQAKLQLTRKPRPLPKMLLNPEIQDVFKFKYDDFKLIGYNPYPRIKAPIAV